MKSSSLSQNILANYKNEVSEKLHPKDFNTNHTAPNLESFIQMLKKKLTENLFQTLSQTGIQTGCY